MAEARKTVRLGRGRRRATFKGSQMRHYNGRRRAGGSPYWFTVVARALKLRWATKERRKPVRSRKR